MVWVLAALMTAAAVAAIVLPLIRRRDALTDSAAYDIEVYKDQLGQIDRDFERGLFAAEEAQAAKTEIARRLLAADHRLRTAGTASGRSAAGLRVAAVAIAFAVPALAFGIYAVRGHPDLPGQPLAQRADVHGAATASGEAAMDLAASAARLAARLETNPDNLEGWLLLARTYMSLDRYRDAAGAYERALGLDRGNPELNSAYGEALLMAAQGAVTPAARAAFQEVLAQVPDDPRAQYYLALADYQAGRKQRALDGWAALLAQSPADAPWVTPVRQRIAETARDLGLDVADVTPQPRQAAAGPAGSLPTGSSRGGNGAGRGPTADDIAAAEAMSPEARQEMVQGMVSGLAARLEENPRDFQGWMRLIRAHAVLGETEKADAALRRALDMFAAAPVPRRELLALGGELGLTLPEGADAATPRGPTAEDMAAAQSMSPAEREEMIRGMVEGLAARLEGTPDDVEGWMRLAHAYNVLGEPEKARDALARGITAAPDNIDALILFGRAERALNDDRSTPESLDAMRRVLQHDPANVEALWFVGAAEAEAGNATAAKALWERALAALPPGSPERAELRSRIDRLKN